MTLTLISTGLNDLTHKAITTARETDILYIENYTMIQNIKEIKQQIRKEIIPLSRKDLENQPQKLLEKAKTSNVGILVGGDALSATTHISLLIEAKEKGIQTSIIHGASIFSAIGETGLSLYKFGKTVTIPLPEKGPVDTVIKTVKENQETGLHTLILLDLNINEDKYLTIPQAIQRLLNHPEFDENTLLTGVARLGTSTQIIKTDNAKQLSKFDFGDLPHTLIAPGLLHFMEEKALKVFSHAPKEALENHKPRGELDRLIVKYVTGCRKVLDELEIKDTPVMIEEEQVKNLIDHTERYLKDSEYYHHDNKPVALASVSYAEGLLDALKLLDLAEFEW